MAQLASSFRQSKEMGINCEECASSPGNVKPTYKDIGSKLTQAESILQWTVAKVKANLFPE